MSGAQWVYDPTRGCYDYFASSGAVYQTACVAKDGIEATSWHAYYGGSYIPKSKHRSMEDAMRACESYAKTLEPRKEAP